jgi:hypothetical protein
MDFQSLTEVTAPKIRSLTGFSFWWASWRLDGNVSELLPNLIRPRGAYKIVTSTLPGNRFNLGN